MKLVKQKIRQWLDGYFFVRGRGVGPEDLRRFVDYLAQWSRLRSIPWYRPKSFSQFVHDIVYLPRTIYREIRYLLWRIYDKVREYEVLDYLAWRSDWGEGARATYLEEGARDSAKLTGLGIDSKQAHVRRSRIIKLFFRAWRTIPMTWIYNNASYGLRLLMLLIIWFALYSLQFAGESQSLNILCSFDNFFFRQIAYFLYVFVFESHHIWYLPFVWISVWLISLIFQWLWDSRKGVRLLKIDFRNAGSLATLNLAQAQILEFGWFLLGFVLLLLNVKNSVVNVNFFDQTNYQLFGFNYSKAIVISCLCFILYGCFLFNVMQIRKQNLAIWKMPIIIGLFVVLFLTLLCILHTSSLLLIIMCLETFGLVILFFMWLNLEKLSASIVMKSILKFFMAQAFASLLYIYGISWLSVEFITLSSMSAARVIFSNLQNISSASWCINGFTYLILGLIMKIGIGPMGFWIFSVIRQLSYATIAVYFTFIKLTYFLTLISILQQFLGIHWENGSFLQSNFKFSLIFIGISILSLLIGTFGLFATDNLKVFLAYSSFVNFGLVLPTVYYGGMTNLSFAFSLPYIYLYSLTTLILIWLIAYFSNLKSDQITDLQNLSVSNFRVAILYVFVLTSLAGLPPFGGFFGKFYILRELFMRMPQMSLVLIFLSVLAALGYGRLLTNIFITDVSKEYTILNKSNNDSLFNLLNILLYIFIGLSMSLVLLFGLILYYYQIEICQISWEFSSQFYDMTILPQRDWVPFFENLKEQDQVTRHHQMWQYFEIVDSATQKLKTYLKIK